MPGMRCVLVRARGRSGQGEKGQAGEKGGAAQRAPPGKGNLSCRMWTVPGMRCMLVVKGWNRTGLQGGFCGLSRTKLQDLDRAWDAVCRQGADGEEGNMGSQGQ